MSVLDANFGKFESKHEFSSTTAWTQNAFAEIMSDRLYSASSTKTTDAAWLGDLVLENNTENVAEASVEVTAATAESPFKFTQSVHPRQSDVAEKAAAQIPRRGTQIDEKLFVFYLMSQIENLLSCRGFPDSGPFFFFL